MAKPKTTEHDGITVVRDDLHPGGTKARFLISLFADHDEIVYASPAEGGAQTALAACAKATGKKATIFVAKRKAMHPRTAAALHAGATIIQVPHGYLSHVQAEAAKYTETTGAFLLPFGGAIDGAAETIAEAARATGLQPEEIWCAAGSGLLSRALALAWPDADRHSVQVGRKLSDGDVAGATIHVHPLGFGDRYKHPTPFPSDCHYDAKAWQLCKMLSNPQDRKILFWNVAPQPFT